MSDFLDLAKEKYSEEVGISFTFFQLLIFLLYLIVSYVVSNTNSAGAWNLILFKSIDDLFFDDKSIIYSARVVDFFASGLLTAITIFGYRKISNISYEYLSTLKNMEKYVENLKAKYDVNNMGGQAMRIYIANTAKEQKQEYMKNITTMNGMGLVLLAIVFSSIIGMLKPNLTDFIILVGGLAFSLFVQWFVFARYTSQVVPRLVLERMARGEDMQFGDEYNK